jgi:solute:Na+ symporter, SSS family
MRAVAYTEALQTVVLVLGSVLVTSSACKALGGWDELRERCRLGDVQPLEAAGPGGGRGHLGAREGTPGRMAWYFNDNYPWLGMLFCAPIIGLWYWCTDQYIVQRALGAPNEPRPAAARSSPPSSSCCRCSSSSSPA